MSYIFDLLLLWSNGLILCWPEIPWWGRGLALTGFVLCILDIAKVKLKEAFENVQS
jgi:hypothetical protein